MSVKIRLRRHGAKKSPFYRIVVSDSRSPRNGRYIEQVGIYNPRANTSGIKINSEKIERWLQRGAQPTKTVSDLIKKAARTSQSSLAS